MTPIASDPALPVHVRACSRTRRQGALCHDAGGFRKARMRLRKRCSTTDSAAGRWGLQPEAGQRLRGHNQAASARASSTAKVNSSFPTGMSSSSMVHSGRGTNHEQYGDSQGAMQECVDVRSLHTTLQLARGPRLAQLHHDTGESVAALQRGAGTTGRNRACGRRRAKPRHDALGPDPPRGRRSPTPAIG